jgi:hypothetical protein
MEQAYVSELSSEVSHHRRTDGPEGEAADGMRAAMAALRARLN